MNKKALKYNGHIFVSVIVFLLLLLLNEVFDYFYYSYREILILFLIAILYGLLPDIDTIRSKIGRIFFFTSSFLIILCFLFSYVTIGVFLVGVTFYLLVTKHRGFTHTLAASLLFSVPFLLQGQMYFLVAFLSYLGHLIADRHVKFI